MRAKSKVHAQNSSVVSSDPALMGCAGGGGRAEVPLAGRRVSCDAHADGYRCRGSAPPLSGWTSLQSLTFPSRDAATSNVAFSYLNKCKSLEKKKRYRFKSPGPKYFLSLCLSEIHLLAALTPPRPPPTTTTTTTAIKAAATLSHVGFLSQAKRNRASLASALIGGILTGRLPHCRRCGKTEGRWHSAGMVSISLAPLPGAIGSGQECDMQLVLFFFTKSHFRKNQRGHQS